MRHIKLSNGRICFVAPLSEWNEATIPASGSLSCALVLGDPRASRAAVEQMVARLVERGCRRYACVGPDSEWAHDLVDSIVEDKAFARDAPAHRS